MHLLRVVALRDDAEPVLVARDVLRVSVVLVTFAHHSILFGRQEERQVCPTSARSTLDAARLPGGSRKETEAVVRES